MVYGDNEGIGRRGYRVGNPLRIAWANDFFRPLQGTYGVMELQPGQVNWGSINTQPLPGAVRLWMWSVFAGGSDFICTYRYRQPLYGTEQYHYGIASTMSCLRTPLSRLILFMKASMMIMVTTGKSSLFSLMESTSKTTKRFESRSMLAREFKRKS